MNKKNFLEKYVKMITKYNILIFTTIFMLKILIFEAYIKATYIGVNPFHNLITGVINIFIGKGFDTLKEGIFLPSFCTILLLTGTMILFSKEKRNKIYYIVNVILSILLFSDLIYYKYYKDFLNITVLSQLFQVIGITGSIVNLIKIQDFIFFIDIILLTPILLYSVSKEENIIVPNRIKLLKKSIAFLLIMLIGFYGFKDIIDIKLKSYGS